VTTQPSLLAGIDPGRTRHAGQHLRVLARDVMADDRMTVEPTVTVDDIVEVLLGCDIQSVPVVDISGLHEVVHARTTCPPSPPSGTTNGEVS
jgi:hypothetical protein